MICHVGERTLVGRAVDCPLDIAPARVAAAVRVTGPVDGDPPLRVTCRRPGRVHDHVGCIHPEMGLRVRTALARAGRDRGLSTPVDDRIEALADRLAAFSSPEAGPRAEREAVAAAGAETDHLAERVAERRGRLHARREAGADADGAAATLEAAVADLAEVETAAVAARQAHDRAYEATRDSRARLAERFALEDDLANARREARAWLVDRLRDAYVAALAAVPGIDGVPTDPFAAPAPAAALAVARVARPEAPLVVAGDSFADADAAAAWLGAPVIRLGA